MKNKTVKQVKSAGCECDIPNAGLPLTGDGICRVCKKQV